MNGLKTRCILNFHFEFIYKTFITNKMEAKKMFQGNVIFNGDVDTSHLNVISVTPYG